MPVASDEKRPMVDARGSSPGADSAKPVCTACGRANGEVQSLAPFKLTALVEEVVAAVFPLVDWRGDRLREGSRLAMPVRQFLHCLPNYTVEDALIAHKLLHRTDSHGTSSEPGDASMPYLPPTSALRRSSWIWLANCSNLA